jgi:FMN phosphatase YigB (HAD superfamily)
VSLTLLIDLDETLLVNSPETFVPAYFQKLAAHLEAYAQPTAMIQALKAGTHQMVQNLQPDCSLKEVFESVFYPSLHLQPREVEAVIGQFYKEIFPSLKKLTKPMPGAVELMESAFQRGYRVAIATTPLFPLTAGLQRLDWAGLSPERFPFALVASFESFHFTKPHPAFFAEVLAQMGWPENPVLVVGDDPINDIQPAQAIGLPTYWVDSNGAMSKSMPVVPTASGDLDGLLEWLDRTPLDSLKPQYKDPAAMQAILRTTPAVLNSMCKDLDSAILSFRPLPEEWSPTEILCHLRDVETEVNFPRLQKLLDEKNPFIPGVDSDRWAVEREYFRQDGAEALREFTASRLRVLDLLQNLHLHDWERSARHAIFGPSRLKELVAIMAGHDQLHVRQMVNTLASI